MKTRLAFIAAAVSLSGCMTIPFEQPERLPVANLVPDRVKEQFADTAPVKYLLMNSVVFRYRGHSMSGLGYISIDRPTRTFVVACMNHVGVKLFDIVGNDDGIDCRLAAEEFVKKKGFAEVVGNDIRNVYLDLIPPVDAETEKSPFAITFRTESEGTRTEYVFSGKNCLLTEKRRYESGKLIWKVGYYEYRNHAGKWFPSGIVLHNRKYKYRLIIRLKEVRRSSQDTGIGETE